MRKVEKILHSVNYIRLTVISNINVPTGSYSFLRLVRQVAGQKESHDAVKNGNQGT